MYITLRDHLKLVAVLQYMIIYGGINQKSCHTLKLMSVALWLARGRDIHPGYNTYL